MVMGKPASATSELDANLEPTQFPPDEYPDPPQAARDLGRGKKR